MSDRDTDNTDLAKELDIEKSKNSDWSSRESLNTPILEMVHNTDEDTPNSEEENTSAQTTNDKDQVGEAEDMDDTVQDPAWEPPRRTSPSVTDGCVTRGASGAPPNPRPPPRN